MKKKHLTFIAVTCIALLTTACGSKKSEEPSYNVEEIEEVGSPLDAEEPLNCDESSPRINSSTDWDAVLDEYEKYVDAYIKLVNKANKGDMSALSEYVTMMEKAEFLEDKLDDADDELTARQIARFEKIINKMSKAAIKASSSMEDCSNDLDDWF